MKRERSGGVAYVVSDRKATGSGQAVMDQVSCGSAFAERVRGPSDDGKGAGRGGPDADKRHLRANNCCRYCEAVSSTMGKWCSRRVSYAVLPGPRAVIINAVADFPAFLRESNDLVEVHGVEEDDTVVLRGSVICTIAPVIESWPGEGRQSVRVEVRYRVPRVACGKLVRSKSDKWVRKRSGDPEQAICGAYCQLQASGVSLGLERTLCSPEYEKHWAETSDSDRKEETHTRTWGVV